MLRALGTSICACVALIALPACAKPADPGTPALTQTSGNGTTIRGALASGSQTFRCGARTITVAYADDRATLTVDGQAMTLRSVESASGARYVAESDSTTSVWAKGDRATLVLRGETLPECTAPNDDRGGAAAGFTATGNEPGWRLNVTGGVMTLMLNGQRIEAPAPAPLREGDAARYETTAPEGRLTAVVIDRPCTDSMTGMPYPNAVTVEYGGRTYTGCGGDPEAMLRAAEWIVEDLNGGGIIDRSRISLAFGADGRVTGLASCNRYTSPYTLTPEMLTIGSGAVTRRACAPSLMMQEDKFLELLANVRSFSFEPTGMLVLRTGDGRTITARRG